MPVDRFSRREYAAKQSTEFSVRVGIENVLAKRPEVDCIKKGWPKSMAVVKLSIPILTPTATTVRLYKNSEVKSF
jgi:hypothetical protein